MLVQPFLQYQILSLKDIFLIGDTPIASASKLDSFGSNVESYKEASKSSSISSVFKLPLCATCS